MLAVTHLVVASLLVASHALFTARGFRLRARGGKPRLIDWLLRLTAQATLIITALIGLVLLAPGRVPFFPHPLLGLLPVLTIPVNSVVRLLLGRNRSLPWLLPVANLLLILLAFVTGFLYTQ